VNIGDRVIREMFDNTIRHGIIVDKQESTSDYLNKSVCQYSVLWDGNAIVDHFYMEIGLRKETR
jgi:hypothetical protein